MNDLDRLSELAKSAKRELNPTFVVAATDPQTIIGLIERVKEAENVRNLSSATRARELAESEDRIEELEHLVENRYDKHTEIIARLEARLRAAEEVLRVVRETLIDDNNWIRPSAFLDLRDALRRYDEAIKE